MKISNKELVWLTSKEVKAQLKIKDCELMHIRLHGEIKYKKVGNAYYYLLK
jgi:hypothetical protein